MGALDTEMARNHMMFARCVHLSRQLADRADVAPRLFRLVDGSARLSAELLLAL